MRRRRRILFVIGSLEIGGAETQLCRLATQLDRRRFQVEICCLMSAGPLAQVAEERGVPVHVIGLRRVTFAKQPLHVIDRITRFGALIRRFSPDIVHGFLYWGYVLGGVVGRVSGVPVIVSSRRSLSEFKRHRPFQRAVEQAANLCSDVIIANSDAVRRDVILTEGVEAARIRVIPNGLDLPVTEPGRDVALREELGVAGATHVVAVISNLIHYKGHRFFIDAWAKIVERMPGAMALLIGEGPKRPVIEAQIRTLGLEASIRLLGQVENARRLLPAVDLYVHPSLEEGFSNAVLEAMAAGLPVVATSVGGNAEAVRDGVTGYLVPPADASRLAAAVLRLLENPAAMRRMGRAGLEDVARFSVPRMVQDYERTYEELLDARTG